MTELRDLLSEIKLEVERCVNCGFCESVCPTLPASGFRSMMGARGRVNLGKVFQDDIENKGRSELRVSNSFYSCLDCFACLQVCPAGVNAGKVSEIGREILVESGRDTEKPVAKMIVQATAKFLNPLGARERCADWANGLEFDRNSDTLLYTGNMYQLMPYSNNLAKMEILIGDRFTNFAARVIARYPSLIKISSLTPNRRIKRQMNVFLRNIYDLLISTGLRFNYLGKDEPYPGTFIYDLGYTALFKEYGRRIIEIFRKNHVRTIITVDPHTYDLLNVQFRKYFPDFDFRVVHYLDYLDKSKFHRDEQRVTLHEPCHFVLRQGSYSLPNGLVSALSHLTYPERSGKRTMCCGGPNELLFGKMSGKISADRFAQLKATGAEKIVTACPICFVNLSKDNTTEDISEFLVKRLKPSGAER
ncbi:MAG: (Fe-S)-binding protein [Thermoplasmatales archaeon]